MDNSTDIISMLRYLEHLRLLIDHMQCEQPYRLNVIDELHINENGHSRILTKLLQYRATNGTYVFLESLLHYINAKKKTNFPDKVVKPDITQEEERIDLWVRDKDFALIFENKACGAFDQDTQLFRYIKRSEDHGYKDEQIYVIYLPPTESGDPSDYSWNGLKESFEKRYVKLSFKEDIIAWLNADVLPNVSAKDPLLQTAMIQYYDYLQGLFNLNENNMENQIKEMLDSELKLPTDLEEKYIALLDASEKYQTVMNELNQYKDSVLNEELGNVIKSFLCSEEIRNIASNLTYVDVNNRGYRFVCEGKVIDFVIGIGGKRWYAQMQWADETPYNERNYPEILKNDKDIYESGSAVALNEISGYKFIYRYCPTLKETFEVYKHVLKRIVEITE